MGTIQDKKGDGPPSDFLGRHGELTSAYKASHAKHSGVSDTAGNDTGYGAGLGGDVDDSMSTSDYNDSDTGGSHSGEGKGVGPATPMVRRDAGGDDSSDSNRTAGGRPVG